MNSPSVDDSNSVLCDEISRHIALSTGHRITFAEYMDLVLYHPKYGYYFTNAVNIGTQGDFFTSPHLGADFGELLAVAFVQMWEILGKPVPFSLVEMGAGQGILAADIIKYIKYHYPDFFSILDYVIVEKSLALKQEQQQHLQEFPIRWCSLEEIPSNSITGCFFSNELVDAMPVHQLIIEEGRLQEVYVTTAEGEGQVRASQCLVTEIATGKFTEVIGEPSTPRLAEYFDLVSIKLPSSTYPNGYRTEVNLAALDWLKMVADKLHCGYLLTIDYGYLANRYYSPARSQGTLVCYYQHRHHDNPYINIGRQDITAHVDFTALERWGEQYGLSKVGFTQQGLFLMALGIGDRIATISTIERSIQQLLQRRDALHQLIDPQGLGGFGVLVQSKGLTQTQAVHNLKGLMSPV
jgi:SAM-dependent MidA family methyltransferase